MPKVDTRRNAKTFTNSHCPTRTLATMATGTTPTPIRMSPTSSPIQPQRVRDKQPQQPHGEPEHVRSDQYPDRGKPLGPLNDRARNQDQDGDPRSESGDRGYKRERPGTHPHGAPDEEGRHQDQRRHHKQAKRDIPERFDLGLHAFPFPYSIRFMPPSEIPCPVAVELAHTSDSPASTAKSPKTRIYASQPDSGHDHPAQVLLLHFRLL